MAIEVFHKSDHLHRFDESIRIDRETQQWLCCVTAYIASLANKPATTVHSTKLLPKLSRNQARDRKNLQALKKQGWAVLTIWECETRNDPKLRTRILKFLL
jgi:G:T-mismatch repair DNA endonuclease (very short patch repair protein)